MSPEKLLKGFWAILGAALIMALGACDSTQFASSRGANQASADQKAQPVGENTGIDNGTVGDGNGKGNGYGNGNGYGTSADPAPTMGSDPKSESIKAKAKTAPPEIAVFCTTNISVAIVLDGSMSMTDKATATKQAVVSFAGALAPKDQVGVVIFNRMAVVASQLAPVDAAKLGSDLNGTALQQMIGTNITQGLEQAKTMLGTVTVGAKVAILFSDGQHNQGGALPQSVAQQMKEADVRIFTIDFDGSRRGDEVMNSVATSQADAFKAGEQSMYAGIYSKIAEQLCR